MYWQQRLDRPNKDDQVEKKILETTKNNPNYGYRRITRTIDKQKESSKISTKTKTSSNKFLKKNKKILIIQRDNRKSSR